MKVGFIGIGVMGSRMVKKFLTAGYHVTVYNRTSEKAEELVKQGAKRARNFAEVAKESDIICTCLSMPMDVQEVYLGSEGLLRYAKRNTVFVDFTTVDVATSKAVFAKAAEKELSYLDAPVSGGPEGVELGSLTIMVGGKEKVFSIVEPLLQVIGSNIQLLGPSGSGTTAKLLNQYLVAVHSLAASEVMVAGVANGLNPVKLFGVLKESYGDSRMLRRHMDNFVLNRTFEPGGAVKYVHKDVRIANFLMEQSGITEYTGRLAEVAFSNAINNGLADLDMSAIIQPLEKKCNVVVAGKQCQDHGTNKVL